MHGQTFGGIRVLLVFNSYLSHVSRDFMNQFDVKNIVVYAFPKQASGRTQPLGVVAFSCFKNILNEALHSTSPIIDFFVSHFRILSCTED